MRTATIRSLSCLLCLATAHAQSRLWTVDVQNRPGTDFTDLQTAFDQVPPGDRVRIRDGSYPSGVRLGRGLVVEADTGVVIRPGMLNGELRVDGVPAG